MVHSSVKEKVIYLLALPVFVQGNKTTVCIRIIISVCCSVLYVYIVQKKILFCFIDSVLLMMLLLSFLHHIDDVDGQVCEVMKPWCDMIQNSH